MTTMKVAFRKIAGLTRDPRNARTHSPDQIQQLKASIRRFGWTSPILADDMIRAGHGRVTAAEEIYAEGGMIHLAPGPERGGAAIPKGTVPAIDCTGWTEDERKAYSLADNQLALQAGWDTALLTEQLQELSAVDFDIAEIGFDESALSALGETGGGDGGQTGTGEMADSNFSHVDQYAVIVKCADEADQERVFNKLRDDYGVDNVKVVVV